MKQRTSHTRGAGGGGSGPVVPLGKADRPPEQDPMVLVRQIHGEVVYAIRVHAMVKIGYTSRFRSRISQYPITDPKQILLVMPGTRDDERALHIRFRPFRAARREWYAPAPHLMRWINEQRELLGVAPL